MAPLLKESIFTTLKKCTKWLGELAGGTSWVVDKMRVIAEANEPQQVEPATPFNALM
jgi:hypothetical protein